MHRDKYTRPWKVENFIGLIIDELTRIHVHEYSNISAYTT